MASSPDRSAAGSEARRVKPLRLGGMPLHPLAVHFPVALLGLVPLLDALAWLGGVQGLDWAAAAAWLLAAGLAGGAVAVTLGLLELPVLEARPDVIPRVVWHMVATGSALSLDLASLLVRWAPLSWPAEQRQWLAAALSGAGLLALAWGGHLGATLVFRHGLGAQRAESQPDS